MAVTTNTHLPKSKKTKKPTVKKTKVKPAKLDVGRPVKYSDEFIRKEADALLVWIADKKSYYIGTFAAERGYNRARLVEFANNNDYFSVAYDKAKQWQESIFITNALTRVWDPGFTSRVMSRVCGPEWKHSWDQAEEKVDSVPSTIIINKIEK